MDPFQSEPAPAIVPPTGPPCPSCGQPMDPAQGSYDPSGTLICRTCSGARAAADATATVVDKDPQSNRNLYGAAAASSLMGVVTCCLSSVYPFAFVSCFFALFIGGATLVNLLRRSGAQDALGAGYFVVILGALGGLGFGGLGLLIGLLATLGILT